MHTPSAPPLLTPPMQGMGTQPDCPVTCDHWERGWPSQTLTLKAQWACPLQPEANFQVSKLGRGQRVSPSCVGRTQRTAQSRALFPSCTGAALRDSHVQRSRDQ